MIVFLFSRVCSSLHQENAFKAIWFRSRKHAFLHHHRGKRASAHLILYSSKQTSSAHYFICTLATEYILSHLLYILCATALMLTTSYLQALKKNGLHPSDPRLKDCMEKLREAVKESVGEVMMDKDLFHR